MNKPSRNVHSLVFDNHRPSTRQMNTDVGELEQKMGSVDVAAAVAVVDRQIVSAL